VLATREIAPYQYSLTFAGLPRDVPLLARIYSSWDGRKQPPVLRLPVMIPSKRLANGDFESLFRAGVPWGWSPVGQAICRDSGPIADQYRHAGKHTLMLILFDNAQEHVFDEKLEIPIRARKGERFKLKCSARYFAPEEVGPRYFLVSAELYDPTQRDRQPRNPGERVSDDWTNLEIELESPCDTPILCVTVVSQTLPKERYLFCIDSITLEPVGR
jgi:hypothetical protein